MILAGLIGSLAASGGGGSTYELTAAANNVDEGSSLTFNVGGYGIVNGTYYWTIETNSSDFTTTNGTVVVTSNSGSFSVTPTADATTDSGEAFTVALRSVSTSGTILVTSSAITINDTSFGLGQYTFNGTLTDWAETDATVATYSAYTYPDETSGSLHTLTGTQYVRSQGWSGSATVCFNLWFYPTANNKIIIGELGQADVYGLFHYSVLEIDSTNHLKGRVWQMGGIFTEPEVTSTGTVTLNAWNHVYLYFNNATTTCGMSLNNEAAVTQGSVTRNLPEFVYWGIGLTDAQNMGSSASYQGKFDGLVISTTLTGSNYTATKAKYLPPLSLVFNNPQQDYLMTPASADWNLGTTWTIEFWINANNSSLAGINIGGGQWGLFNQGGWFGGLPANSIIIGLAGGKLTVGQGNTDDAIEFAEPTAQQWTHVAVVNNGGGSAQKVYYNGAEQAKVTGNYLSNGWTNTTDDLYIGRLKPPSYGGLFDGKLALVRISNTAKYLTTFSATTTYGVEADTKLFLSLTTPLVDSKSHTITNNGVTTSTDVPTTYILTPSANSVNEGSSVTFTISGTNITNGTYYWTVTNSGDFGTTSGSFSITSNSGSFSVTPTADFTTEGSETFTASIRSGSITGTVLQTSTSVTITDTSLTPSITITNVSIDFYTKVATVDFTSTVSQSDFASVLFEWNAGGSFDGPFNLNVNPGSNTYTSPALNITGSGSDLTTEITIGTGSQACTSNIYTGSWSVQCLVEGTMITMADGSHKAVENIGHNDLIRVWNFDLGEFSESLPVFVKQEETYDKHYRFTFSDGTVLRTVGHHVFNKQAGEFTMLVRDTTPVGTITFNEQGEEVTLIAKETIEEPVKFYNVWTQYHLNLFAQGILTSNRFNNIYPIQDMKFVKDNRALRPLEEFADIDPKYISGLRLQEQPKQYSAEYIKDYIENKLERLDIANVAILTP